MNYTQQLGLNAGQIAIDTAGRLQQQDKQRMLTGFMQEDRATQQQQAQGDIQARQQAAELLQNGTPEQIAQFGIKHPDIMKDIINGANFIDERAKQSRLKYAQDVLSGSVNPRQAINDRIAQIESAGGDASGLKQTAQLSDDDVIRAAEKDFSIMDSKGYESYKKAIGGSAKDDFKQQEIDIKREANQIRRLENEQRALDRQISRETNELKRQELEAKLESNKSKSEQAKREVEAQAEGAINTFDNTIGTIDKILNSAGFGAAVGARLPFIDSLPGTDAQETIGLIDTLKSQAFLNEISKMKGMGALSDAEGKKVADAIGSLNRDMKEKAFRKSLGDIKSYFEKAKVVAEKKYGKKQPEQQAQQNTVNWSDL